QDPCESQIPPLHAGLPLLGVSSQEFALHRGFMHSPASHSAACVHSTQLPAPTQWGVLESQGAVTSSEPSPEQVATEPSSQVFVPAMHASHSKASVSQSPAPHCIS